MRIVIIILLSILCFFCNAQTYNPSIHAGPVNKPLGISSGTPLDSRSYYYNASTFSYRAYGSRAEILSYLNLANYRSGQFPIILDSAGRKWELWFRDGTADANLIYKSVEAIQAINGMVGPSISITSGSSGNDFGISSVSNTVTLNLPIASATNTGKISNTDWITFNNKENVLTFSNGLTRSTNNITNNLITGISGGQTVVGGTNSLDSLRLKSNLSGDGQIRFGTSNYNEATNRLSLRTSLAFPYALTVMPDTSVAGIGGAITLIRPVAGVATRMVFKNQNGADRVRLDYDVNDNFNIMMDGLTSPHVRVYRQGEVSIRSGTNNADSINKLTVVDTKVSQNFDRIAGSFIQQANFETVAAPRRSYAGAFSSIASKSSPNFSLTNVGLYINASRADSNYAAIFDSGIVVMRTLPISGGSDSSVVVDSQGRLRKGAPPGGSGSGITQLTGDVLAGPGTGSQVATIANNVVTDAKFRQSAATTLVGNPTGSTANVQDVSLGYGITIVGTALIADTTSSNGLVTQSDLSAIANIDTSSLSNRINQKVDSAKARNDSLFYYWGGLEYYGGRITGIDVFIIGGQSNAVGYTTGTNVYTDNSGKILQYYQGIVKLGNDPVGNSLGISAWPSFGIEYFKLTGRLICFVPCAESATAQVAAADTGPGNWDVTGTLWQRSVDTTIAAIAKLRSLGYNPTFKGVLWDQGETDAVGIRDGTPGVSTVTYRQAFQAMMQRYRNVFGKETPLYLFKIGTSTTSPDAAFAAIRRVQDTLALQDSLVKVVFYGAYDFASRGLLSDNVHYNQGGYNEMGRLGAQSTVSSGWNSLWKPRNYWSFFKSAANNGLHRIGVGVDSPQVSLHIGGNLEANALFEVASTSARGYNIFRRARGTIESKLAVINNDSVGSFGFSGWDGTTWQNSAFINAYVNGTVSSGNVPMRLEFWMGDNGSTRLPKFIIDQNAFTQIRGATGILNVTNDAALGSSSGGSIGGFSFPNPTAADQRLGNIGLGTRGGSSTAFYTSARIEAFSEAAFTPSVSHPTSLRFSTAIASGGNATIERVRITSTGSVLINTTGGTNINGRRFYNNGSTGLNKDSTTTRTSTLGLFVLGMDTVAGATQGQVVKIPTSTFATGNTLYTGSGTLSGNTVVSGANNSLQLGTAPSPLSSALIYSSGLLQLFGSVQWTSSTAIDNNLTVLDGEEFIILPTITATRTITLPSNGSGKMLIFWNKNASGNSWQFGSGAVNADGTALTTIPNSAFTILINDGANWGRITF